MNSDQQGDDAGFRDEPVEVDLAGLLAGLLARAAAGDVTAFVAFYDHTSPTTFRYALGCRRGDRDAATDFTRLIYLEAWRTADQHPASGLSPLAWLIAAGHHHRFQHPPTTITEHAC